MVRVPVLVVLHVADVVVPAGVTAMLKLRFTLKDDPDSVSPPPVMVAVEVPWEFETAGQVLATKFALAPLALALNGLHEPLLVTVTTEPF